MIRILIFAFAGFCVSLLHAQERETLKSGRLDILKETAADGFLRANRKKTFRFPEDHGPHPGFRHEWWYVTGNLDDPDGRRFGYELTFFRFALVPETEQKTGQSSWKTPVVFAAHFALTDPDDKKFHFFERYSRADNRLAGATHERVWLENWSIDMSKNTWKLDAGNDDVHIFLELVNEKQPILQGEDGLSRKSEKRGNATYYYSIPRMQSDGSIQLGDVRYDVSGQTWLDREWGTSALSPDQQGWDWFALQLSDGSDLMFYNLRNLDGTRHPNSAGSWINENGTKINLAAEDVEIEITDYWDSPNGGRYPSAWRLRIKKRNVELLVKPILENQELITTPRYWEGAVDVVGQDDGKPLNGRGYVELTGYAN